MTVNHHAAFLAGHFFIDSMHKIVVVTRRQALLSGKRHDTVPIAKLFQELIHNWVYILHNEATTLLFNDSLLPGPYHKGTPCCCVCPTELIHRHRRPSTLSYMPQ